MIPHPTTHDAVNQLRQRELFVAVARERELAACSNGAPTRTIAGVRLFVRALGKVLSPLARRGGTASPAKRQFA